MTVTLSQRDGPTRSLRIRGAGITLGLPVRMRMRHVHSYCATWPWSIIYVSGVGAAFWGGCDLITCTPGCAPAGAIIMRQALAGAA